MKLPFTLNVTGSESIPNNVVNLTVLPGRCIGARAVTVVTKSIGAIEGRDRVSSRVSGPISCITTFTMTSYPLLYQTRTMLGQLCITLWDSQSQPDVMQPRFKPGTAMMPLH
jgi:hypothetical protein